ncbi:hypothetical protein GS907_07180 [Rhodococcus hoagii]|uniref:hypothetical protein n=1 Tax=Rhodococcus hoagii TaxID=43767 RepID=UPI000A11E174|nr:hypothetical protein [Prescottella equi]NKT17590.1 hypothetical protein [Prescottella equi]NKU18354.1 hypothetical protein [Prescottella equi]ORL38309.1 hypothetical protein A6I87_02680 [Prescottella equi]
MPFATPTELTENWRPLKQEESSWAGLLLEAAERWIRRKRPNIADDDPDAKIVTIAVVKNALIAGEHEGFVSFSRALGPRSKSGTLSNPDAALVWLDWMKDQLGISQSALPVATFGDGGFCERW